MKASSFVLFLAIVLCIYGGINFYIFRRGWHVLSRLGMPSWLYAIVVFFLVLAFPLGRIAERGNHSLAAHALLHVGAFYLGAMVYFFLFVLVIDLFRLGNHLAPFFPKAISQQPNRAGQWAFLSGIALTILVLGGGFFNARHLRVRRLDIAIEKKVSRFPSLNIVLASDIHMGVIVRNSRLKRIIEKINSLEPDLVLFAGDIVDENVPLAEEEKMVATLRSIHAPYGVFSVTGNHEYYGGLEKNLAYLRRGNVTVLQDETAEVANSFYVIGRKDRTALRFGEDRLPLRQILQKGSVDGRLPLLLLDHQPLNLEEAEECGIDIELSGHTHNGQLFPLNLINKLFYELNWGYKKRGKTHYYVSCGAGTWGPPIRTAGVSEIILLRVIFQ
ncbi:MAG: metallophosphoesterase [Candidatus Aminicenantales bacterium]